MPLKVGNVKQIKAGTALANLTSTLFTLPAQAQIIGVAGFGTITGTITLQARPINSATPVTFATIDATQAAAGAPGALTGAIPFNRQSVPVVITASGHTAGDVPVSVTFM